MWSIKEIKQKGKKTLKNNLWTLLLIGLFMTIVVGKYAVNNDSLSNLNVLKQFIEDRKNGKELTWIDKENPEVMLNKYLDEMVSQMFSGNSSVITDVINDYNEKNNVTKGVFYTVFNVVTKGHEHVQKIIQTIASYENKTTILKILIIVVAAGGMAIKIFISYPIQIGETRIYLESRNYKKTKVYRMLYPFRKGRYLNVIKSMLRMEIYQLLWNLTIVGGIIKKYSYKMIMYIIAENPQISSKDAIRISREMMDGNKLRAFLLDLSFIGWNILQYITFGLAGIYVSPYYTATEVELYAFLRKEYIENKKYGYELLNDTKLYEENPETASYPDAFEFERKKIKMETEELTIGRVHHGRNIRRTRIEKNMNQEGLSELVHLSQPAVSKYEKMKVIDDEMLQRFARALNVPFDYLKTLEEDAQTVVFENNTVNNSEQSAGGANISMGIVKSDTEDSINDSRVNNFNPIDKITELYERLLKEKDEKYAALERRLQNIEKSLQK